MRNTFSKIALAAGFLLAITFTFSCSSGDGDNNPSRSSEVSSSSVSSSSYSSSVYQTLDGCPDAVIGVHTVTCGGQEYKTVKIGTQTWMAENFNYDTGTNGSKCNNNDPANCDTYGRLYNWATAMSLPDCGYGNSCSSQIGAKHRGICPSGWHIPTKAEWDALSTYIEGDKICTSCDATYLKASSGWYTYNNKGNGTNAYGFAALPGSGGFSGGEFHNAGNTGYWWSATEGTANNAYYLGMSYYYTYTSWDNNHKGYLLSVRCLQD
jgi:uncharacterized protein (TIGR02145 family)